MLIGTPKTPGSMLCVAVDKFIGLFDRGAICSLAFIRDRLVFQKFE